MPRFTLRSFGVEPTIEGDPPGHSYAYVLCRLECVDRDEADRIAVGMRDRWGYPVEVAGVTGECGYDTTRDGEVIVPSDKPVPPFDRPTPSPEPSRAVRRLKAVP